MHPYLISLILGIIEGLTEFLPVSSTAHLRIAETLYFKIDEHDPYWKAFTVVIQLGAVLCLPVYFWRRMMSLAHAFPRGKNNDRNVFNHPLSLTLIAFFCTAVPAFLAKKMISKNLENIEMMAWVLIAGGVAMWAIDVIFRKPTTTDMDKMSLPQAVWIGLIQTLAAIFPGLSRSMATISAGQSAGLSRTAALEFSFFLSIPTMFAATGLEMMKVVLQKDDFAAMAPLATDQWIQLAIGFMTSFVVSLVVVHLFMGWVRKHGFIPFAIYRVVAGMALIAYLWYYRLPA